MSRSESPLVRDVSLATPRSRLRQQRCVPFVGGRHLERITDSSAETVDGERDVLVLVGIDADDDIVAFECKACHDCCSLRRFDRRSRRLGGEDRTAMGPWWISSYEVTARPAGGALRRRRG